MTEETTGDNSKGMIRNHFDEWFGALSLGAGIVHGFCDAQGMPLPANVEEALTWAPMMVNGLYGTARGAISGGCDGAKGARICEDPDNRAFYVAGGAYLGSLAGGIAYTAGAGFLTLLGYGIGYGVSYLLK